MSYNRKNVRDRESIAPRAYARKKVIRDHSIDEDDEDEIEIEIAIPLKKIRKGNCNSISKSSDLNLLSSVSTDNSSILKDIIDLPVIKPESELTQLVRQRLSKSSGFTPDLSSLPKPPETVFVDPLRNKTKEEKQQIMSEVPLILAERVSKNVNPERVRKAQMYTYNKMMARACGSRWKQG